MSDILGAVAAAVIAALVERALVFAVRALFGSPTTATA